jgi:hypothetical protein
LHRWLLVVVACLLALTLGRAVAAQDESQPLETEDPGAADSEVSLAVTPTLTAGPRGEEGTVRSPPPGGESPAVTDGGAPPTRSDVRRSDRDGRGPTPRPTATAGAGERGRRLDQVGPAREPPAGSTPRPDRDCRDFGTWREAQDFFLAAGGPTRDPHGLDRNHDGIACQDLPGAPRR